MNFYILLFLTAFFASMIVLTTMQIVNGIDEDQSWVCKHEMHFDGDEDNKDKTLVCTIMDDGDLFTYDQNEKLYYQLQNDIDTFEILETSPIEGSD